MRRPPARPACARSRGRRRGAARREHVNLRLSTGCMSSPAAEGIEYPRAGAGHKQNRPRPRLVLAEAGVDPGGRGGDKYSDGEVVMDRVWRPLSTLDWPDLTEAFNLVYQGYVVPLALTVALMRQHVEAY